MEIALSSIIILVLLLPGISFNKGYYSGEFSRQYLSNDFFSLLINTLLPSILIYALAFPIVYLFGGYYYDVRILLGLTSSDNELVKNSIALIDTFIVPICSFQLIVNLLSFTVGLFLRNIILQYSLDTRFPILKFNNNWHYLISGRFFEYNKILQNDQAVDVDLTFVDALLNINGQTFIYTGILEDYELGKDGSLELLTITNAQRKLVTGNDNGDYKDISGNYLVLKYSDLININFSFIQFDESVDTNGDTAVTARLVS